MIRSLPIWAVAAALACTACSSDLAPRAEALAERACACEDASCADEVNTDLEALLREASAGTPSEAEQERLLASANRIGTCIAEHLGVEALGGEEAGEGHSFDPDHDHDHSHGEGHDHEH